jgi:hypothetical protein
MVERTLGWFNRYRRLSTAYESHAETNEAMIQVAMIHLMVRQDTHDVVACAVLRRWEQTHGTTRARVIACLRLHLPARGFFPSAQTPQDAAVRPRPRAFRHGLAWVKSRASATRI